jgi:hypothetical protein
VAPSREDLERLLAALEKLHKKRRIILAGYLVAAVAMIVGELAALYVFGTWDNPFRFWVFFVPFTLVGLSLLLFGMWAKKIR